MKYMVVFVTNLPTRTKDGLEMPVKSPWWTEGPQRADGGLGESSFFFKGCQMQIPANSWYSWILPVPTHLPFTCQFTQESKLFTGQIW